MFIDMHHFTDKLILNKLIAKLAPSLRHILEKIAILFVPLPLFMLFSGTTGIIEKNSPEHLATISSMGSSFFNSFEMHSLILAGAFGITFIIWVITRKVWNQSDEQPGNKTFESDPYEKTFNEKMTHSDKQVKQPHTHLD